MIINYMIHDCKSHQFINYENNIADKTLKYIGIGFINLVNGNSSQLNNQ